MKRLSILAALVLLQLLSAYALAGDWQIVIGREPAPRIKYGADRLAAAITAAGQTAEVVASAGPSSKPRPEINVSVDTSTNRPDPLVKSNPANLKPEGFAIDSVADSPRINVVGADDNGALYGCLELAQRIGDANGIPTDLHVKDAPAFKLRGPCIGMQKTYILPGRKIYEYPYTPDLFPFFYDKQFWTEYLDFLVDHRMNVVYLWSGHPFASLVKLPDYPYAVEVPDNVFQKNVEMMHYIATECDKRGIWFVQMFYNIIVSKPFADHNQISTQLKAPTPLVSDYTRKSIAEFVKQYPNVGLLICLGEALSGEDNQVQWLDDVILPEVKDGMAQAHLTKEPPIIIRAHATNLAIGMPQALKIYKNLYSMEKYNGESLTTWEPRGKDQKLHLMLAGLGPHIVNIHILSNLEPFRYGAQRFIKLCMIAARDRLGADGVHVFPLSYWNWPDAPDKTTPPLQQLDRDWIWYEAWARYAWNPDIDETTDHAYWINRIGSMYGEGAGENILAAYNDSGECAPRLVRWFGITEGNRQTLSLGMTLDQLLNPEKYGAIPDLWESQAPPGERLDVYTEKEWNKQPHEGETPPQIVSEVLDFSQKAVKEIEAATPDVKKNTDEFKRLKNDMYCIQAMSQNYADKVNAAMLILHYDHSQDIHDLEKAEVYLGKSLDDYRQLVKLTDDTYNYANSMQTGQRKIPAPGGGNGKRANYLWSQLLPRYEKEFTDFQAQVDQIKNGNAPKTAQAAVKALPAAQFTITSKGAETFPMKAGEKVFTDAPNTLTSVAPELAGLTGIRFSNDQAKTGHESVEIETKVPVQVLIGYFKSTSDDVTTRKPPNLETDANAQEKGSIVPLIQNAAAISSMPAVNLYNRNYPAGKIKLDVPGTGSFVILGVIPQSAQIAVRDAQIAPGK